MIRVKSVSSTKSINDSYIRVFDGKWRYRAASDTPRLLASFAVVILLPGLDSNISASV